MTLENTGYALRDAQSGCFATPVFCRPHMAVHPGLRHPLRAPATVLPEND